MVAMENPTGIARLVQFKAVAVATQPRLHRIQHLNEVTLPSEEVAQLDISAKWLQRVEVCASPSTERVHIYSCDEGI